MKSLFSLPLLKVTLPLSILLSACNNQQNSQPSAQVTPFPEDTDFETILANLDKAAVPEYSSPQAVQNRITPKELQRIIDEGIISEPFDGESFEPADPTFNNNALRYSANALAEMCPSLIERKVGKTIVHIYGLSEEQLRSLPSITLNEVYYAAAVSPNSKDRSALIRAIFPILPNAPLHDQYMDQKRAELHDRILGDQILQAAKKDWKKLSLKEKEKILDRVMRLTLDVLLPGKQISYPSVIVINNDHLRGSTWEDYGAYFTQENIIMINGTEKSFSHDWTEAIGTAIHESFHAYQSIIVKYYKENYDTLSSQFRYQAEIWSTDHRINIHATNNTYTLFPLERDAFAFELAARDNVTDRSFTTDKSSPRADRKQNPDTPKYKYSFSKPAFCR